MPVFFFAVSQSFHQPIEEILVMFLLLHLLVYPASNAYNSFHDNDSTSVGGLKSPPHINAKVLLLANLFDILCLSITIAIMGFGLFLLLLAYIITSRAYSHRKIRLKKYPYIGFLVIFIFQGAFTYYLSSAGIGQYWGKPCSSIGWKSYMSFFDYHLFALSATSFQIGAIYPLTQIYQHESDIADGVTTLSYKLGYKGTFIFSAVFFAIATTFYFLHFKEKD
ncbi:MAG: UbiA family prenyltransferase, partial [Bacteroidia bacterium]